MNIPEFEYFYNYFMPGKRTVSKRVSLYFEEILKLVSSTNSIKAINNEAYYQKLKRKADKLEFILNKIIVIDPDFLSSFSMDYYHEKKDNIITILKESFYNTFKIDGLLPVLLSSKEKIELTNRYKNLDIIDLFILDFSGINYFSRYIDDIKPLKSRELTNEEKELIESDINKLFFKASRYPYRHYLASFVRKSIYLYDIDSNIINDVSAYLKDKINSYKLNKKKMKSFGFVIPKADSIDEIIKINELLEEEFEKLNKEYFSGKTIKFDIPRNNSLQSKKVNIINSYFDENYKFKLDSTSSIDDYVKEIVVLNELAYDIADFMFKELLFVAHNSANVINKSENYESMYTIYNLYSSKNRLEKYKNTYHNFMDLFNGLDEKARKEIIEKASLAKIKKNLSNDKLIPDYQTIVDKLIDKEIKFLDSHAVEEFKYRAMNHGKYYKYDLEIIAKNISVDDLAEVYKKLKRNIIYTNFVDEIGTNDNKEEVYREARIAQNKTLAVLQEMIAKSILNKTYTRSENVSYDGYQILLNSIYNNILHEKRLLVSYEEEGQLSEYENEYLDKKKEWDEQSTFVSALYYVVSKE